ncbi:glycosyltransferase family 4 protein [Prescottella equi]|uniref:glycosyltransferase family 4 protein n=1 Tax=Rhodococcus hoagii TaxID=43767 RepID=UPI00384B1A08
MARRGESPIYVFAGEVGYRKGFDRLAAAWAAVLQKIPEAQLRVAGPLASGYQLPEHTNVEYLGNLSRTELLAEIAHATATLLPSRAEVLPMVVIESLAQGTPVVYTRVGEWSVFEGAPGITLVEVLGRTEEEVSSELAGSMIALADAPTVNQTEITAWAQERFSAQVVADQLHAVYREVLEIEARKSLDPSSKVSKTTEANCAEWALNHEGDTTRGT